MPFCGNCGQKISDTARFCESCGTAVLSEKSNSYRRSVFEGKIHKCPNCGEILKAFELNCPACGYELRDRKTPSAVKEFVLKLEYIESRREYEKPRGFFTAAEALQRVSKTDEQKISLIKSFSVPNSKEDMLEFMILATSNINTRTYDSTNTTISKSEKELSAAWYSKAQQVYEKAKHSYSSDSTFTDIKELYDSCNEKIKKAKKNGIFKWFLLFGWIPLIWIIIIVFLVISEPKEEAKELQRLENIVIEVEMALENDEYDLAMMHAKSIDYSAGISNDEMERQWDIKRDYLIKKIIDVAAEDGIVMEYPTDTADEKDKQNVKNYSNSTSKGYQQNIEEFNNRLENTEEQLKSIVNDSNNQADTSKEELIGFEDGTYKTTNVKNFTFEIPNYWQEEGSKNEYLQYYAEKGDKCVMLSIAYPKEPDDKYDVSFDGLYADNENMIQAVGAMFTDGDVIDYEIFESNYGVKGILYRFTYNQKIDWFTKTDGSGYCFCFPSEDERRWFYVVLLHTNNISSDRYTNDYMTLISSIKEKS